MLDILQNIEDNDYVYKSEGTVLLVQNVYVHDFELHSPADDLTIINLVARDVKIMATNLNSLSLENIICNKITLALARKIKKSTVHVEMVNIIANKMVCSTEPCVSRNVSVGKWIK